MFLPFPYNEKFFDCNSVDGAVRNIHVIEFFHVEFDILGGHAFACMERFFPPCMSCVSVHNGIDICSIFDVYITIFQIIMHNFMIKPLYRSNFILYQFGGLYKLWDSF